MTCLADLEKFAIIDAENLFTGFLVSTRSLDPQERWVTRSP